MLSVRTRRGNVERESTTPVRVLVIDDEEGIRNFAVRSLTRLGFSVSTADGGTAGIALLSSQSFDAVVCDLKMPDRDGFDVLRFASTLPRRPPIIVLTGHGSIATAVEAMRHGAVDFIEKPADVEVLRAAVLTAVNRAKAPRPKAEGAKSLVGSASWLDPFYVSLKRIA